MNRIFQLEATRTRAARGARTDICGGRVRVLDAPEVGRSLVFSPVSGGFVVHTSVVRGLEHEGSELVVKTANSVYRLREIGVIADLVG
jgi:hypothetical protein